MKHKMWLLLLCIIFCSCKIASAQIEADYFTIKDYHAIGFGGFLNFAYAVTDANYMTFEVGVDYFDNKDDEEAYLLPVLIGYRYTLNQSGDGLYVEPNAGYAFGETTIMVYDQYDSPIADENGWVYRKIAGPTAGITLGYLFPSTGWLQMNVGVRYQHGFGKDGTNMFTLRVSHAFTFGRRRYN